MTERIVKHQGTAIMLRNAGEPAVSTAEIGGAIKNATHFIDDLSGAFQAMKDVFIKTGESMIEAFRAAIQEVP